MTQIINKTESVLTISNNTKGPIILMFLFVVSGIFDFFISIYSQSSNTSQILISLCIILLGIFFGISLGVSEIIIADRSNKNLLIIQRYWFSILPEKKRQINFSEISKIEDYNPKYSDYLKGKDTKNTTALRLVLKNGEYVLFGNKTSIGGWGLAEYPSHQRLAEFGKMVAEFCGITFEDNAKSVLFMK